MQTTINAETGKTTYRTVVNGVLYDTSEAEVFDVSYGSPLYRGPNGGYYFIDHDNNTVDPVTTAEVYNQLNGDGLLEDLDPDLALELFANRPDFELPRP